MARLLYIHGFLSSSRSQKALETADWIAGRELPIEFLCPSLSNDPRRATAQLAAIADECDGEPLGLVGSSLGGFYATWLSQTRGLPAVLVNPAVRPQDHLDAYLGPNQNPYTGEKFEVDADFLQSLAAIDVDPLPAPEKLLVMLQTGDETLDYRQALDKYAASRQIVENGGDHRFQNYDRHLPTIMEFLRLP